MKWVWSLFTGCGLSQIAAEKIICIFAHAGYTGRYCGEDIDGCSESAPCFEGVDCVDNPAPAEGITCGPCPQGFTGDGSNCLGTLCSG